MHINQQVSTRKKTPLEVLLNAGNITQESNSWEWTCVCDTRTCSLTAMATDANRSKRLFEMIAWNDLVSVFSEAGSKPADAAFFIYVQEPSTCIGQRVSTQ